MKFIFKLKNAIAAILSLFNQKKAAVSKDAIAKTEIIKIKTVKPRAKKKIS